MSLMVIYGGVELPATSPLHYRRSYPSNISRVALLIVQRHLCASLCLVCSKTAIHPFQFNVPRGSL